MGQRQGEPNAAEIDTMRGVVSRAMQAGAFGVASALIYPPGAYAGTAGYRPDPATTRAIP